MSSRSSQRTVVNSVYGDRPIVDLPSFRGYGTLVSGYSLPHSSNDLLVRESDIGAVYNRSSIPSYSTGPEQQLVDQTPTFYGFQPHYGKSNIIPAFPYSDYQHHFGRHKPFSYHTGPPYGNQSEIHHYYGPNGERLPGPSIRALAHGRTPHYNINFTVEGKLNYGKMVSIKIRSGNISFHDIPDFVLADIKRAYRFVRDMKVVIVAEGGEYSIYSEPLNSTDHQSLSSLD